MISIQSIDKCESWRILDSIMNVGYKLLKAFPTPVGYATNFRSPPFSRVAAAIDLRFDFGNVNWNLARSICNAESGEKMQRFWEKEAAVERRCSSS